MTKALQNVSLKWKMAGATSLILALATLVVLWYFPYSQQRALTRGITEKVRAVANMLGASIVPALDLSMGGLAAMVGMPESQQDGASNSLEKQLTDVFGGASLDKSLRSIRVENAKGVRKAGWKDERVAKLTEGFVPSQEEPFRVDFGEDLLQVSLLLKSEQNENETVGVLRLEYSLDDYNQQSADSWKMTGLICFFIFFVGALVVTIIGMRLAAPLRVMASTFRKMAEGDLTQDPLMIHSGDEIGQLAQAYNDLLGQLRALSEQADNITKGDLTQEISQRGDLGQAFKGMTATFAEIARRFSELSSALDERTSAILTTTRQQEAGAAQQASTVSEVTATMGELAATARQIAGNAERVTDSAEQAGTTVAEGRTALSKFVQSISEIENGNRIINDNIVQLNRHVQQIGGIIDLINDIADRSDLLALNAALEGTKAGEAGKGFLLVAGEMRRLAENVFNSTAEIKQLIAEVTEATNATVMATESGMKATRKGVTLAEDAEMSFDRIVQTIEQTTHASKQISVATQQQHTGTDQIVSAMAEVSDVAQQSLDGIRQTAQSVGELSTMSSLLRKMIANYKVSKEG